MRFQIKALEERIVLDAAAVVDAAEVVDSDNDSAADLGEALEVLNVDHSADQSLGYDPYGDQPVELLVISSSVTDNEILQRAAQDNVVVVFYDSAQAEIADILEAIEEALDGRQASNIGFVNDGDEGLFLQLDVHVLQGEDLLHTGHVPVESVSQR